MKVFFSYARADSEQALAIARELTALGVGIWLDQLQIQPGLPWDAAVESALRDSETVVVLLSRRSVTSANVLDEVALALATGKRVVPVQLEPCAKPLRLHRLQHVDAECDPSEAARRIFGTLRGASFASPSERSEPLPSSSPTQRPPSVDGARLMFLAPLRKRVPLVGVIAAALAGTLYVVTYLAFQDATLPAQPQATPDSAVIGPDDPACQVPFDQRPVRCLDRKKP